MSDELSEEDKKLLIETLRDMDEIKGFPYCGQAADEIERLDKEIEEIESGTDFYGVCPDCGCGEVR